MIKSKRVNGKFPRIGILLPDVWKLCRWHGTISYKWKKPRHLITSLVSFLLCIAFKCIKSRTSHLQKWCRGIGLETAFLVGRRGRVMTWLKLSVHLSHLVNSEETYRKHPETSQSSLHSYSDKSLSLWGGHITAAFSKICTTSNIFLIRWQKA